VWRDEPEEEVEPAVGRHDPGDRADVERVLQEDGHDEDPGDPERDAQRGDPRVVGPDLEREAAGGVLGVVAGEVVLDEPTDVDLPGDDRLRLGAAGDPRAERDRDERGEGGGAGGRPAGAVDGRGERDGREASQLTGPRLAPAGHRGAGPGHEPGQARGGRRIGRRRPQHGEVGRGALVEDDELVDLRGGQPAPAQELLQAAPLRPADGRERVEVHGRERTREPGRFAAAPMQPH
jgi:hypothetical protein